jgi:glycosyltransferase involved in cell wall biosynthesis
MNILFLCQGDPETRDSWSGVNWSILRHLRDAGHTVIPADVEISGLPRMAVAMRTLSRSRRRWWVRYHLGESGFRARSRRAARWIQEAGHRADVILQVGATFEVPQDCRIPVAMYCDGNIAMASDGADTGYSDAAFLTREEILEIRGREERVYRRAGLIFTMSHRLRRSFIQDFQLPPGRLATVHCGPNLAVGDARPSETRVPPDPPSVLFVGRDFHRKGGDLLLEAFHQVRRSVPGARLTIVGPGPAEPSSLPEWVEVLGYLDRNTPEGSRRMDAAYRNATLFCLPTRFEPFGTSFVEAMLYGLPCVGPDAWAVPEIIVPDQTGLLVRPEDPEALARALVSLLLDRPRASRMGSAGRARVLAEFSWEAIAHRMTAGMQRLIQGESHPVRSGLLQGNDG